MMDMNKNILKLKHEQWNELLILEPKNIDYITSPPLP